MWLLTGRRWPTAVSVPSPLICLDLRRDDQLRVEQLQDDGGDDRGENESEAEEGDLGEGDEEGDDGGVDEEYEQDEEGEKHGEEDDKVCFSFG